MYYPQKQGYSANSVVYNITYYYFKLPLNLIELGVNIVATWFERTKEVCCNWLVTPDNSK